MDETTTRTTPRPQHPAWNGDMGPCVCPEHRTENERHLPTAPRPDPVTAARDALVRDLHRLGFTHPDTAARIDHLIALARAEAGVPTWLHEMVQSIHAACSLSLDDPDEWPNALRDIKAWCSEALAALAARSAESGSRAESMAEAHGKRCADCGRDYDSWLHVEGTAGYHPFRPTPPPAVNGTPLCAWSGDAGELRKDAASSRVICDQPKDASNHKHSMLCPREHEPELICHGYVAPKPIVLPDAETLARTFHEAYERMAPRFGYTTREESAVAWDEVPVRNRDLMRATSSSVLSYLEGWIRAGEEPSRG